MLSGWALTGTLFGIFLGGLALNLTPCVYPLIPITVSYFGGKKTSGTGGLIKHGLYYVGGLAVTNSLLGVIAAFTGGLIGGMLQHPVVLIIIAAIMLGFGLSLFGFWELRVPFQMTQVASRSYAGYFGSFFMGLTLGVVAAPCIGPFVLGLLTWVAALGDPVLGFVIFFTLSLGLGSPLFLLALFSGRISLLPKSGEWMNWVRRLLGWVLVGMAAYFIRPVLPIVIRPYIFIAIAVVAGLHLGWLDRLVTKSKWFPWLKTLIGTLCLVYAVVAMNNQIVKGPSVRWHTYSGQLLDQAVKQKKPVIIDFYADWCSPCRELDEITFHHPDVVKRSKNDVIMIKVDITDRTGDQKYKQLLNKYRIKGVPTVIFIDAKGNERKELRLIEFERPEAFLNRMISIK